MQVRIPKNKRVQITDTDQVYHIMQSILKRENKVAREQTHYWMLGLDTKHRLLFIELLALGDKGVFELEPRQILKLAVIKDAKYCILAHNRPKELLGAGKADLKLTGTLVLAAWVLGIILTDHIVISETAYYSYSEKGIIEDLRNQVHI